MFKTQKCLFLIKMQSFAFQKGSNCRYNLIEDQTSESTLMILLRICILISIYMLREVTSQIVVTLNTTNITISNSTALAPDPYFRLIYPNDYLTFTAYTPTSIWTLSLNNTVQILNKSDPSVNLNTITQTSLDFRFQSTTPLSMIIFNENYGKAAITGFVDSSLICYLYDNSNTLLPVLAKTLTVSSLTTAPATSFIAGEILYSFFSNSNTNDTILGLNTLNNSTVSFTLATKSSSLVISPNRKYALVWNQNTKIYIYSVPNFTLLYTYNGTISPQKGTTETISFSIDGTLALIQTDNHNPVTVLNLTSFSVLYSITIHGQITSVEFLDAANRYILIVQNSNSYVYDTQSGLLSQFNATLQEDSVLVDQNTSQLIVTLNNTKYVTNVNITVDSAPNITTNTSNTTLNSTEIIPNNTTNSTTNTSLSNNITNTTNNNASINTNNTNNSASSQNTSNTASSSFGNQDMCYRLNLSQTQNQTFADLQSASAVILNVMTNFNVVIFSSPFTCFFLGFFNYFTLNSLYILLNIQLPDIIFKELSALFASSNANLLTSFGIFFSPPLFTHELVDSPRALHFAVSSDLLSSNYYSISLVLFNLMFFQLMLAFRARLSKDNLAYSLLDFDRHKIYFGFAVYLMVGLVLPSQFMMNRRMPDLYTVANSAVQCLLYIVITQFLWSSLIEALRNNKNQHANKVKKIAKECKQVKKVKYQQLPEWMIAFQNLLYPLLVLLPNVSFFLIAVLISKISEIVIFARHSHERGFSRGLQIGSFICEVIYHCTFIIFSLTRDEEIIIYNSLFCLIFFYLGALLNLTWTVFFFIKLLKMIVKAKRRNKIVDVSKPSSKFQLRHKEKKPPLTIFLQNPLSPKKKLDQKIPHYSPPSINPINKTPRKILCKKPQVFITKVIDV